MLVRNVFNHFKCGHDFAMYLWKIPSTIKWIIASGFEPP
ncbi:hypothetical protein MTBSS4_450037 [Magnetospirillum sp. SS-4]|nr:hypothetical protein MTBSS4_450037 [Magnetospirillum sp. SS-4]